MIKVPNYLQEVIERHYDQEGLLREIIIRTPSSQLWAGLSQEQQQCWKELVIELGADPEDYLRHQRKMLPSSP